MKCSLPERGRRFKSSPRYQWPTGIHTRISLSRFVERLLRNPNNHRQIFRSIVAGDFPTAGIRKLQHEEHRPAAAQFSIRNAWYADERRVPVKSSRGDNQAWLVGTKIGIPFPAFAPPPELLRVPRGDTMPRQIPSSASDVHNAFVPSRSCQSPLRDEEQAVRTVDLAVS